MSDRISYRREAARAERAREQFLSRLDALLFDAGERPASERAAVSAYLAGWTAERAADAIATIRAGDVV